MKSKEAKAPTIDWFRVVTDLERSGLSQAEIGRHIGRSQIQVNAYKCIPGTEPKFTVGMLLLALWQERCGQTRAQRAPTL